jgi:hypothetical protein
MLAVFAAFKESLGEPKPTRTWMLEQGSRMFLDSMKERFPEAKPLLEKVELQHSQEQTARRGVVRAIRTVASANDGHS